MNPIRRTKSRVTLSSRLASAAKANDFDSFKVILAEMDALFPTQSASRMEHWLGRTAANGSAPILARIFFGESSASMVMAALVHAASHANDAMLDLLTPRLKSFQADRLSLIGFVDGGHVARAVEVLPKILNANDGLSKSMNFLDEAFVRAATAGRWDMLNVFWPLEEKSTAVTDLARLAVEQGQEDWARKLLGHPACKDFDAGSVGESKADPIPTRRSMRP